MLLGRDVRNVEGCPHGKAWFGYERKNAATISKNYTDQRTYARTRVIGTEAGQEENNITVLIQLYSCSWEGNPNDISFPLFLNSDIITFPKLLRGSYIQHDSPKNIIKFTSFTPK